MGGDGTPEGVLRCLSSTLVQSLLKALKLKLAAVETHSHHSLHVFSPYLISLFFFMDFTPNNYGSIPVVVIVLSKDFQSS